MAVSNKKGGFFVKCRVFSALLSLCLLFALFPAAQAEESSAEPVVALCVCAPGESALLDADELLLLCQQATRRDLESVSFDLLPASVGTLTCKGEKVIPGEPYYMYEDPQLSQIRFTPYAYHSRQFTGRSELSFTMTDERGNTIPGTLILYVPEGEERAENYLDETITAKAGEAMDLTDHFPFYTSTKGDTVAHGDYGTVNSLTFELPSSDQGALWLDYGWSTARKVLPEEVLYPDREPNFYNVTFVPAGKDGITVELGYTVSCIKNEKKRNVSATFTLNLVENKSPAGERPSTGSAPSADPVTISTRTTQISLADPLWDACAARKVGELVTVTFDTLPAANTGVILCDRTPVVPGKSYEYGRLSFLPGENFQEAVTLRYVGTDSIGYPYSGTLILEPGYPSDLTFQDLEGWDWAIPAARFLEENYFAYGDSYFRPGDEATRMDVIYAIYVTLYSHYSTPYPPEFSDLPQDRALRDAVAAVAKRGIIYGDGEGRLLPDAPVTRQDALVMVCRALEEQRDILPPAADLSVFSDAEEFSPYAREAAGILQAMGILQGDGSGKLNPLSPITRAEMACLVYRAFS